MLMFIGWAVLVIKIIESSSREVLWHKKHFRWFSFGGETNSCENLCFPLLFTPFTKKNLAKKLFAFRKRKKTRKCIHRTQKAIISQKNYFISHPNLKNMNRYLPQPLCASILIKSSNNRDYDSSASFAARLKKLEHENLDFHTNFF